METAVQGEPASGHERLGHWQELVRDGFAPFDITTDRPDRFRSAQHVVPLGRFQVWQADCSRSETSRTPALIRRSDPETLCLLITLNGTLLAETAGRNVVCAPGDLYIHDTSHPMGTAFREASDGSAYVGVAAMIPRAELRPAGRLHRALGLRVPRGDAVGGLMATFLTDVVRRADALRPADSPGLGATVRELASTLVARVTAAEESPQRRRCVLALQVKEFALHHLGDPELTPARVAAAHHISVSYLHEVFRDQDTTVARWIRGQRLESARRDLADPSHRALAIREIAVRWGFRHPADFTRAFRTAYGLAPREYRSLLGAAASRGVPGAHGGRPEDEGQQVAEGPAAVSRGADRGPDGEERQAHTDQVPYDSLHATPSVRRLPPFLPLLPQR